MNGIVLNFGEVTINLGSDSWIMRKADIQNSSDDPPVPGIVFIIAGTQMPIAFQDVEKRDENFAKILEIVHGRFQQQNKIVPVGAVPRFPIQNNNPIQRR